MDSIVLDPIDSVMDHGSLILLGHWLACASHELLGIIQYSRERKGGGDGDRHRRVCSKQHGLMYEKGFVCQSGSLDTRQEKNDIAWLLGATRIAGIAIGRVTASL